MAGRRARRIKGWVDPTEQTAEIEQASSAAVSEILAAPPSDFQIPEGAIQLPAHGWRCRPYQDRFWRYMLGDDLRGDGRKKFAVLNWHRRAGKDAMLLNLIAVLTTRRRGMYWHGFPLLNQARRAIWEGFMNSASMKMLDYLPMKMRDDQNQQELRINLSTGSTYQLVGGDSADKLTGSGPIGAGFSEYAQMNPAIWDFCSPMMGENDGWVVFISTPRGKNHFYDIYNYAANTPGCFAETLTVEDTWYLDGDGKRRPVITQEYLDGLRKQGKSEEFIRQEFYCDWNSAVEGAVYSRELLRAEAEGRYGDFPYDPRYPVYTAWDLGTRDMTVIPMFQLPPDETIRIIDLHYGCGLGMPDYARHIRSLPYKWATHYAPWDVANRSLHYANSVMDVAAEHGIRFQRLRRSTVNDGIEGVRAAFPRMRINKALCSKLWNALKAYSFSYDEKQQQFGTEPVHDYSSHFSDAVRYMCQSLPRNRGALTDYRTFNSQKPAEPGWDVLDPTELYHHA
jgi:phage terminase large subunit